MFHYTNEKDMKNFLDKNVVCKTKEDKIQVIYMGTDSHYIPNKGEE